MRVARLTIGLCTAVALLVVCAPAGASFPGRNGEIAAEWFYFDRGGENETKLDFVDSRGHEMGSASLCRRPEFDAPSGLCPGHPAYSADGSRLAFGLDGRLAVANPDGSGIVRLPPLTDAYADPSWSPRGDRLAFTGRRGKQRNIYLVNVDGTGLRRLTSSSGGSASWSSRGRIAYVAGGVVYRLVHGKRVRVARGTTPDWSPSGRSLAYSRKKRVYVIRAKGGAHRKLVAKRATDPVFSPDSRRIAFLRSDDGNVTDSIFVVGLRGGRARRLIEGGELPIGSSYVSFGALAWRPR